MLRLAKDSEDGGVGKIFFVKAGLPNFFICKYL